MSVTTRILRTCLALAMGLVFWGCAGKSTGQAPKVSETGTHPAGWLSTHWSEFAKNPDQCATCHGSVTDPAAAGGIAKVSCFTCHANGPAHPTGWSAGLQHGRQGAQLVAGSWTGIASCGRCHGADFTGGIVPVSCKSCHQKAPHPDKPWRSLNPAQSNHDATDVSNAPQCYVCHAGGANSTIVPTTPALPGTPPGCYNATMCHDRNP